ncbi:alkaline phosphatase-like protein [Macrophomina phaseolina]|uniref:Alkaline phosphatase-like protein n=1 Tax=Macrophomina phaseolina TaxID=35725 RepID=A0ABQ8G4R2_9PEZI|nr:alkaline phosphatase-like protein [Macrophomina phaseolina]
MFVLAAAISLSLGVISAESLYERNMNFLSPSENHAGLGLNTNKLYKRQLSALPIDASQLIFTHGVASGDPAPDFVILWTRISPDTDNDRSNVTVEGFVPLYSHETEQYVEMSEAPVCADYQVGTDEAFSTVVDSGKVYTTSEIDFTVKVEARGLSPFTTYFYQFTVCDSENRSPIGRTKTMPAADDEVSEVSLAVFSCANWPYGFFNAYGNAARKDSVDYVVHLGDYIYETSPGTNRIGWDIGRLHEPAKELVSLYDYRRRLAQYREDSDLLLNHQRFPWIPVWDDHETANDQWRGGYGNQNNTEESWEEVGGVSVDQRKMHAVRAYFEWMPIRQVDMDDNLRIWRSFSIGRLADLIMLDTRGYDRSITDLDWNTEYIRLISDDAGRTLMGSRQETWFYNSLSASADRGATWRIVGSQVIFSRMNRSSLAADPENPFNRDAWDGYQGNRNRTFAHLYDNTIPNNIFLAGDSHANWVSDLAWLDARPYDPTTGAGAVGVEFALTAVSSVSRAGQNVTVAEARAFSDDIVAANEELQWNELWHRGYIELTLTAERAEARFFGIPDVKRRSGMEVSLANFTVLAGEGRLERPVAGGMVESGSLKGGETRMTNQTVDTGA